MNFKSSPVLTPLRVLMVNPLSSAAQLTAVKMMTGAIFGKDQLIDLILLVYSNERSAAENLKLELHSCGFPCMNTLAVSSDLPLISDADVFCFITNFKNPNMVDFNEIDNDQFDVLYLIIKIANSLCKPSQISLDDSEDIPPKNNKETKKPIIMADGFVAMNILHYMAKEIPGDCFFCPTPLPPIARNVLGDHLKVASHLINEILVWAGNDEVFHIEVETPLIIDDKVQNQTKCDWDMVGRSMLKSFNLDHTQFNETWLKKEFIEKVLMLSSKNPYGSIYRASEFSKTLGRVWWTRSKNDDVKENVSIGVISDGSLGTIKGFAYVLPVVFTGDTWTVNKRFEETVHLQQEIKRINAAVIEHKKKLVPYCKKFLEENVKNQAFIPSDDSRSDSGYLADAGEADGDGDDCEESIHSNCRRSVD